MAAHNKQFTLYSVTAGPNPWKVNIILEELNLPYETVYISMFSGTLPSLLYSFLQY